MSKVVFRHVTEYHGRPVDVLAVEGARELTSYEKTINLNGTLAVYHHHIYSLDYVGPDDIDCPNFKSRVVNFAPRGEAGDWYAHLNDDDTVTVWRRHCEPHGTYPLDTAVNLVYTPT